MDPKTSDRPRRGGFDQRAFVGTMIALTGIGLPVTGVANHLYQSAPLDLARHSFMAAHNACGLLFTIFVVWHVALNGRRLVRHLRGLTRRLPFTRRESLYAGGLTALVLALFVGHAFVL